MAGFFIASARAENIVKNAIAQSKTDDEDMEEYFAESKKFADELKRNNLFAPPPPKQHPVKEVWGIFGDQVLINDKWYNVGDAVGDAKIVAIGPTSVSIEWDGKEKPFLPIESVGPKAPSGSKTGRAAASGSRTARVVAKAGEAAGESADMVVVRSGQGPIPGREGRRGPGGFSGEGRDGFREAFERAREGWIERWQNASEEERAEMRAQRERFERLPEEERRRIIRERFGGRPPGGREGGGRGPGGRGPGGRR
ncbi:MAG: hypothetical protein ACYS80_09935 [Planctomycetota bacterium]